MGAITVKREVVCKSGEELAAAGGDELLSSNIKRLILSRVLGSETIQEESGCF